MERRSRLGQRVGAERRGEVGATADAASTPIHQGGVEGTA